MPWQERVALVGGEIDADTGLPAYREVIITVPRQSGKTTLILSWEVQRAVGWRHAGPQRIAYSAQTGNDARKKLIEDQVPLLVPRKKTLGVRRILRGMGNEAVEFLNGSRIVLLASSEDSGHGKTIDLGVKDELFADDDDRRDQALVPAMATRSAAQTLTASTMGTDESDPLNRAVDRGREYVDIGVRSGTAYFEWSAPEDCDPDDLAVWWACMPALGHTITEGVVRHARQTLELAEFRRAFLNIRDSRQSARVIPASVWVACQADERARPSALSAIAFDIPPDRSSGSIAGAAPDDDENVWVDILDHGPGTGWMVDRLLALKAKYPRAVFCCDATGPAGSLLDPLQKAGFKKIKTLSTREHQQACGGFFDAAREHRLRHAGRPELDAALAGAEKRLVGDAWLWSRKHSSVDISPLVAVTLAHREGRQKRSLNIDNYRRG